MMNDHSARAEPVPAAGGHERSLRPSPSGGGLHALEIYPVVQNMDGLEPGLYHYNPGEHTLETVSGLTRPVTALSDLARISSLMPRE